MAKVAKRRGRYILDFYDHQGKRRRVTLPSGTSKKAADEALRDIQDRLSTGTYMPEAKVPKFEQVADDWLAYKKPNIRQSTWSMYDRIIKLHLQDLMDLKINQITIATVEKWITGKQEQNANLASLRKWIVTFNQIMAYAVRHRYIAFNPVRDAERPKDQGQAEAKIIRILKPHEIRAFLENVTGRKYQVFFKLAIMSGVRQGELIGLKWTDIDWINSQVHIQRTFNCGRWYRPKSKASNRRIDIGPDMLSDLRVWHKECPESELNLVFPNLRGNPIDATSMLRLDFHPAMKKAKIGRVRFHDLRHTYASLLIDQGENVKYIQRQLGHTNPTVTLNVYAHLIRDQNQEAVRRLENTVFTSTGHNWVTIGKKAQKKRFAIVS